jgi:alkyldihydroxyacetonephosphate synthase
MIEQYAAIKSRGTAAILAAGGTLTHHHSVGFEHQPWMKVEHSPAALNALRAVKAELDPTNLMNPGSLLPPAEEPRANDCLAQDLPEGLPSRAV